MPPITLRDILINARQESVQMRHYYLGVEHLFIALLQIQGGLTSNILTEQGLTADYVIDTLRRKTGKGLNQRLWVGIPYTPRTEIILNIANDLVLDDQRKDIDERDLLSAIIAERDSLPIRVLKSLGVDIDKLEATARTFTLSEDPQPPNINVVFGPNFDRSDAIQREHLFILRRMFASHAQIRIERRLTGFRKSSFILVVTPVHADNREDAPVVVKIDQGDNILDEVQRYEAHVKNALPLQTARLEDSPTAPESSEMAGIKYTLVASSGAIPQDMRSHVRHHGVNELSHLLRQQLYSEFNKTWWKQSRPFRFQVWKEYDWLLPPILTLDFSPEKEPPPNAYILRIPFNRARLKNKLQEFQFGDYVVLENFIVQKIDRENDVLKLAIGYGNEADKRAYKIEVRGLDLNKQGFYRGEVVERIIGKVWKTRHELLMDAVQEIQPDFDFRGNTIPVGEIRLPNPLMVYEDLLDRHVNGSLSKIHGDLHLGNILVGPNNSVWLIDFAHTRDGHTLFDWATLEVSLLAETVMAAAGESWDAARTALDYLIALEAGIMLQADPKIAEAIAPIAAIREIVRECLTDPNNWIEYYIALALCALRAISWNTMALGGRRLMLLVAGLAIQKLNYGLAPSSPLDTPSPDEADLTDNFSFPILDAELSTPAETPGLHSGSPFPAPFGATRRFDEEPYEESDTEIPVPKPPDRDS
jgi:ATP-dependent Clp protease ATP-binding subunit ClpC